MDLSRINRHLDRLMGRRARRMRRGSQFIRLGFVLVGSFIATAGAIASSVQGTGFGPFEVAAVGGAFLALVGGAFLATIEEDATSSMRVAQRAVEDARSAQREAERAFSAFPTYERAIVRLEHLYTALNATNDLFERVVRRDQNDETSVIRLLMSRSARPLRVALGFELSDVFTIGVYRVATTDAGRDVLRCIAHHRSIDCTLEDAREWPVGVGAAGIAFAKNAEIVVPDMGSDRLGTLLTIVDDSLRRPKDAERYGSMFAVPVQIAGDEEPWGAVIATSSVANHFGDRNVRGIAPEEAVRALSGLVALAVAMCRGRDNNAA